MTEEQTKALKIFKPNGKDGWLKRGVGPDDRCDEVDGIRVPDHAYHDVMISMQLIINAIGDPELHRFVIDHARRKWATNKPDPIEISDDELEDVMEEARYEADVLVEGSPRKALMKEAKALGPAWSLQHPKWGASYTKAAFADRLAEAVLSKFDLKPVFTLAAGKGPGRVYVHDGKRFTANGEGLVAVVGTVVAKLMRVLPSLFDQSNKTQKRQCNALKAELKAIANSPTAVANVVRAQPQLLVKLKDIDSRKYYFNTESGVIDLEKIGALGKEEVRKRVAAGDLGDAMLPHDHPEVIAARITKLSPTTLRPYVPNGPFQRALDATLGNADDDPDHGESISDYFQLLVAPALVGYQALKVVPKVVGPTNSGKSSIAEVLIDTLGPNYASTTGAKIFHARTGDVNAHSSGEHEVFSKRLNIIDEDEKEPKGKHGVGFSSKVFKDAIGIGDSKVTVRLAHAPDSDVIEKSTTFILFTNELSMGSGMAEEAVRRRAPLFNAIVREGKDKPERLGSFDREKIKSEALGWLLIGWARLTEEVLRPGRDVIDLMPKKMAAVQGTMRQDASLLAEFMDAFFEREEIPNPVPGRKRVEPKWFMQSAVAWSMLEALRRLPDLAQKFPDIRIQHPIDRVKVREHFESMGFKHTAAVCKRRGACRDLADLFWGVRPRADVLIAHEGVLYKEAAHELGMIPRMGPKHFDERFSNDYPASTWEAIRAHIRRQEEFKNSLPPGTPATVVADHRWITKAKE